MLKKILSHSFIYAIGPQVPKLIGLLILPLITPFLTNVDYGVWGTIMAYTGALAAIKDLGLFVPMLNSFYKHPHHWRWVWRRIHGILIIWSIIFLLIQSLVIYYALPIEAKDNLVPIILLTGLPVVLFDIPVTFGNRYFQLSEKPLMVSIGLIASGITTLVVNYFTISVLKMGYMGWFISSFCGYLVMFAIYFYPVYFKLGLLPIFRFKKTFVLGSLKIALPIIPHNYSSYLLNASDRMVMNWYNVPTAQIGLYNIAYMWGNYMDMIGGAVGMAVGPIYLKLYAEKTDESEKKIRDITFLLQIIFLTGCFLLALWIREIFQIFIRNPEMQYAHSLAVIIIMSFCYYPMYWIVISRLQFYEHTNKLWRITAVGGILNLILNLFFIPIWGYQVAAYTTLFSMLYIAFAGFQLKQFKKLDVHDYFPLMWLILILIGSMFAYLLKDIRILYKGVIMVFILGIASVFVYSYSKRLKSNILKFA